MSRLRAAEVVSLYYDHIRTYPDTPDRTWTPAERMADIRRDLARAGEMLRLAGDVVGAPTDQDRAEASTMINSMTERQGG